MPKQFWRGLIIVVILYTIYYISFIETKYLYINVPRKLRHLIAFVLLFSVYITGVYHLTFKQASWMKSLWHFIHIGGFIILVFFGLYDWIIRELPLGIKLTLIDINEFLIGPTLYVVMAILDKFFVKQKGNNI
jgi:hypothetical protein